MHRVVNISDAEDFWKCLEELNKMRPESGNAGRITLTAMGVGADPAIGEVVSRPLASVALTPDQRKGLNKIVHDAPRLSAGEAPVNVKLYMRTSFMPLTSVVKNLTAGVILELATKMNLKVCVEVNNSVAPETAAHINRILQVNNTYFDPTASLRAPGEGVSSICFMWPKSQGETRMYAKLLDTRKSTVEEVDVHPIKVEGVAVPYGNGEIIICGGYFDEPAQVDPPHYSFIYTPATDAVTEEYRVELEMIYAAAAFNPYEECVYVAGIDIAEFRMKVMCIQTWDQRVYQKSTRLMELRRGHAVALLSGTTMMIAGGIKGDSDTQSEWTDPRRTEIVDIVTGSVTEGPRLIHPRVHHTMTRLKNGDVFVVGGSHSSTTTEIFRVGTGTFVEGPALLSARQQHAAFLHPNGKVEIIGGKGNSRTVCFYDPETNQIQEASGKTYGVDFVDYDAVPVAITDIPTF
jgi:hypothetical protein